MQQAPTAAPAQGQPLSGGEHGLPLGPASQQVKRVSSFGWGCRFFWVGYGAEPLLVAACRQMEARLRSVDASREAMLSRGGGSAAAGEADGGGRLPKSSCCGRDIRSPGTQLQPLQPAHGCQAEAASSGSACARTLPSARQVCLAGTLRRRGWPGMHTLSCRAALCTYYVVLAGGAHTSRWSIVGSCCLSVQEDQAPSCPLEEQQPKVRGAASPSVYPRSWRPAKPAPGAAQGGQQTAQQKVVRVKRAHMPATPRTCSWLGAPCTCPCT